METVFTGWRTVTPGACSQCGFADDWSCDGRGNVMCGCQACSDCGILDAYGMHNAGCAALTHTHTCPDCKGSVSCDGPGDCVWGGVECATCPDCEGHGH